MAESSLNHLVESSGVWILIGLLLGWIFRGAIKSAFEKMTNGVFNNPVFQPPPLHWKGIDQDLFNNPDFSIVTGGLVPTRGGNMVNGGAINPSSTIEPAPYKFCSKCGKGKVSARALGINNTIYGAKGQLDPYKTNNPVLAQAVEDGLVQEVKEGMCGCAVNGMYDWDNRGV